jgi:hypothetical protein
MSCSWTGLNFVSRRRLGQELGFGHIWWATLALATLFNLINEPLPPSAMRFHKAETDFTFSYRWATRKVLQQFKACRHRRGHN